LVFALVEMLCRGWKAAPAAGSAARVSRLQVETVVGMGIGQAAASTNYWEFVAVVGDKMAQAVELWPRSGDVKAAASNSAVVAWSEYCWEVVLEVEEMGPRSESALGVEGSFAIEEMGPHLESALAVERSSAVEEQHSEAEWQPAGRPVVVETQRLKAAMEAANKNDGPEQAVVEQQCFAVARTVDEVGAERQRWTAAAAEAVKKAGEVAQVVA
jgi:hypothetical protein